MFGTPKTSKPGVKNTPDSSAEWKQGFIAALKNHQSDSSADFTIVSVETTFKVHRLVASIHSGYFKRLCDPDSEFKEGSEGRVELNEDPTLSLKLMVDDFYTFDYPEPMSSITELGYDNPGNSLEAHSQVFTLADKYDVPGLRELAYGKFKSATKVEVFGKPEYFQKLAADLLIAVPHIYNNTPPDDFRLQTAVVAPWLANGKTLLKYVDDDDLEDVFQGDPNFATDLISKLADLEVGSNKPGSEEAEEEGRKIASVGKKFSKKVEASAAKTEGGAEVTGSTTPSVQVL